MFEALPVVIPTLRDVARGTLRPAASVPRDLVATAELPGEMPTAAILLDAATPSSATTGALYDELELYLQAAHIESLRLHRRRRGTTAQMLDILACVTLLRSRGCRRVILILAVEGAVPPWEPSRAETLAGMLKVVRRHHSSTATELIGAIEDLVKTIRSVADTVIGVATVLVSPSVSLAAEAPRGPRAAAAVAAPAPHSPQALTLAIARGDSQVSAVSQLYLWCCSLAGQGPTTQQAAERVLDDADAPAPGVSSIPARPAMVAQLSEIGAAFQTALRSLETQWDTLMGDVAHHAPHTAARALAAAALQPDAMAQARFRVASLESWRFLDLPTRLKWLDVCQQTFASLRAFAPSTRIENAN